MRRALAIIAVLGVAAIVVLGLSQAGGTTSSARAKPFDVDEALRALEGAPAPIAALHRQANDLLEGGPKTFRARLRELRGHPVVVNKWASWCGPCRTEFPIFQSEAVREGKRVAFVGVNAGDSLDPARRYLRATPLPFPSYLDPDEKIAREIRAPANYPITVFVDAAGKTAFIHQGGYTSRQALSADIDRYLGA